MPTITTTGEIRVVQAAVQRDSTISIQGTGTVHMIVRHTMTAATWEIRVTMTGVQWVPTIPGACTTTCILIVIVPIQPEATVGTIVDLETTTPRQPIMITLTIIITMVQPTTRGVIVKTPTGHLQVNAHHYENTPV